MYGNELPKKQGLYDPKFEKDSCGVGFITHIKGEQSHYILKQALQILKNLKHRGAVGADPTTGDGSGIMLQIPHEFLKKEVETISINLPDTGDYAVGMIFLPRQPNARLFCEGVIERIIKEENQILLGWREVPVNEKECGESARATRPVVMQIFIDRNGQLKDEFERRLLIIRKCIQKAIVDSERAYMDCFYICSLSTSTIVYKGQILGYKLDEYYIDLKDEKLKTAIAIVHERYSTNTFPSWKLAQPFRYIAHNGEINTIRGNTNWMNAREGVMNSNIFKEDFKKILPVIESGGSDSASLDNALELFAANGHPLENIMMMLIPEAWQKDLKMNSDKRGFYEYHARLMEPWDGPSTIAFTDGVKVGVTLDRNGLRPARYLVTKDDVVVMASEVGVLDILPEMILEKGSVEPGKILLIDTNKGRIISDEEIKSSAYGEKPYVDWISKNKITIDDIKTNVERRIMNSERFHKRKKIFGYTESELKKIIAPMANEGKEAIASMNIDEPLAILSDKPQLLFNYFKQIFAQVTNPPIDPIREKMVMSLVQFIGNCGNLLDEIEIEKNSKYIELKRPILINDELEYIKKIYSDDFQPITIPALFEIDRKEGIKKSLQRMCKRAEESVNQGYNIIILSDRNIGMYNAPIPSLLALGAVHHHLVRKKLRTKVDLIVECGDARDVMHMALLLGYGAKAINPYMAFETIAYMMDNKKYIKKVSNLKEAFENYLKALCSGILKVISRMGIATLQSYNGAQVFEAIGINQNVIDEYFTDTPSRISGIGLDRIASEVILRHSYAYDLNESIEDEQEHSTLNTKVVQNIRKACLEDDYSIYKEHIHEIENEKFANIRELLNFKNRESISIEEVEPIESIFKRFLVSGMSFGSLSKESHETIAIAMNSIGGTSNSGEGGEDSSRYLTEVDGKNLKSAVKQIASGRFGVTTNYLVNCDELQIKMAQGAKPGEGGHLPGEKVTEEIARFRHSIPGIDLISPPPHHDIYSIEDLSQLIFDLKNANPKARISVKLVSEVGVGTVAAGVAKAYADVIMISGHDGGTGASPISSMKYTGMPWELGIAEAQQTLLLNDLRSRVKLQVDGKMKTGRDVVIAALLGAEEYGFATTALISLGCIMCRQCHLNRCPAGITTQDLKMRKEFKGRPEHLVRYLTFIAREIREIMAQLGFRTIEEMIGRVDVLKIKETDKDKIKDLDLSVILHKPELPSRIVGRCIKKQEHKIDNVLDKRLIEYSKDALEKEIKIEGTFKINNTDRAVGTMLSGEVARRYGDSGLSDDTIKLQFEGSAGQSFGAFAVRGLTLILEGDANDYVGKGLSGGKIIVVPPKKSTFDPGENIIAGNTILYGATSGESYIVGKVGQRFCVRNSGAVAVVEGVGNHGCEYMTGGIVVILGSTGKNFGAGMSGGVVYVLDEKQDFEDKCNKEIVKIKSVENSKDIEELKNLIIKHYEYTKSFKAKTILSNWDHYIEKFVKVSSPVYEKQLESIHVESALG